MHRRCCLLAVWSCFVSCFPKYCDLALFTNYRFIVFMLSHYLLTVIQLRNIQSCFSASSTTFLPGNSIQHRVTFLNGYNFVMFCVITFWAILSPFILLVRYSFSFHRILWPFNSEIPRTVKWICIPEPKVFPAKNDTVLVEATSSEEHLNFQRRMGPKNSLEMTVRND